MNKVVVKSTYDKKMHKKFYLLHMFKRSYMIYFVIALALLVTYMAIRQTIANPEDTTLIVSVWILTAFTVLITPTIMILRITSSTKKEANDRKDSIEIIEFTKDKVLRRINGESKITLGWYNIDAIYESKEAFFLYLLEDQGLVVKKDGIVEGDVLTLRKLIKNHMKPNKRGKIKYKKTYKGE